MLNKIKNITEEKIYKIITLILSSFLYSNLLPIMMFIIYMKQEAIFSYDFFTNGLFGLSVFYFFIVLFIIFLMMFLTSGLFFITEIIVKILSRKRIIKKKKSLIFLRRYIRLKYNANVPLLIFVLIINTIGIYALISSNWDKEELLSYAIYFILICTIITIHFSINIFAKAKIGFFSLLISFSLIIITGTKFQDETAGLVKHGLTTFGSAGKKIEIRNIADNNIKNIGEILLLSPDNIYLLEEDNNQTIITIVKRENVIMKIFTNNKKPNKTLEEEQVKTADN